MAVQISYETTTLQYPVNSSTDLIHETMWIHNSVHQAWRFVWEEEDEDSKKGP